MGVAIMADRPLVYFFWRVLDRLDLLVNVNAGEIVVGAGGMRPEP